MYVLAYEPDCLVFYLPKDAPIGFAPGPWPKPTWLHPWDRGSETRWHGPERRFEGWYLNLQDPLVRTEIGIDTSDHELDIVTGIDGSWRFEDLELLESCVVYGRFSRAEADTILVEGRRLGRILDAGDRWWGDEWAPWAPEPEWTIPPTLPRGWDRV